MPVLAQVQDNLEEVRRVYCGGSRLTAAAVFPAFAGIALTAPLLVPLAVGKSWIAAVPLIALFALNAYRKSFNLWNSALLRGLGKPEWLLAAEIWRTVATIALIFLLLPQGSMGVCLAVVLGTFVSWPLAMRYVARLTGLSAGVQLRQEAPALAATLIMAAVLLALRRPIETYLPPWPGATVLVAAGVAAYLGGLALVGRAEMMSLIGLLKNIRDIFRRAAPLTQEEPADSLVDAEE